jgi:hypothetical protein
MPSKLNRDNTPNPWVARVNRSGVTFHLGQHPTKEAAAAVEAAFSAEWPSLRMTQEEYDAITERCVRLSEKGFSQSSIARQLGINRMTVARHLWRHRGLATTPQE